MSTRSIPTIRTVIVLDFAIRDADIAAVQQWCEDANHLIDKVNKILAGTHTVDAETPGGVGTMTQLVKL